MPRDDRFGSLLKEPSIPKAAIEVLKNADGPMTSARVMEIVNAGRREETSYSSVSVALKRLETKGRVKSLPGMKPAQWVIRDGEG